MVGSCNFTEAGHGNMERGVRLRLLPAEDALVAVQVIAYLPHEERVQQRNDDSRMVCTTAPDPSRPRHAPRGSRHGAVVQTCIRTCVLSVRAESVSERQIANRNLGDTPLHLRFAICDLRFAI